MSNQVKSAPKLQGDLAAQVKACTSVSGQIRLLNKAGMSRGDISRTLGKRYQHVRNVLEGDKIAKTKK